MTTQRDPNDRLVLGNYELRFEREEFGHDFEVKARNELRETPEVVEEALKELKALIAEEPGFKFPTDDDLHLKIFLRPCKFYAESAFKLMQRYFRFRAKKTQYFKDLLPSRDTAPYEQSLLTIVPMRNKNGERILIIEVGKKWKPKTCSFLEFVRGIVLLVEAAVEEPRTQVAGAHVILDMEGLALNHVWQFTPTLAKDILDYVQECLPMRIKGIHIVNQPYVFNMLYAIFKPFIGEKLRKRILFHGTDFEAMQEYLDRKVLPLKYEGAADIPMDLGPKYIPYISTFEQEYKERAFEGYGTTVR